VKKNCCSVWCQDVRCQMLEQDHAGVLCRFACVRGLIILRISSKQYSASTLRNMYM